VGRVTSGPAARDLRLAAVVLLGGGVACGVAMGFALSAAGRARPGGPSALAGADGLTPGTPASPALAGPRSLMNPPPPSPPPLAPPRRPVPPPWLGNERPGEYQSGKHQSGERQSGEQSLGEQWSAEQSLGEQPAGEQAAAEELSGDPGPADRGLVAGRVQPGQRLGRHVRGVAPLAARPGQPAATPAQRRVTRAATAVTRHLFATECHGKISGAAYVRVLMRLIWDV